MLLDAPAWSAETDDTLRCVQVRQETHDVKTLVFNTLAPRRFAYRPGQFITLSLPAGPGGALLTRSYTLSSSPTRPQRLSITVKRVPGGPGSNWLHDHLQPGMTLEALGPSGEFSCFAEGSTLEPLSLAGAGASAGAGRPAYLLLSGGSGITPMLSMVRSLVDVGADADIVFAHAARTPEDLIAADELALLARQHPRLRLVLVCESVGQQPQWLGHLGRVDLPLLQRCVPDLLTRDVYCCGPTPFMAAMRALLQSAGHPPARYREESFDFALLSATTSATAAQPAPTVALAAEPRVEPAAEPVPAAQPVASSFQISLSRQGDRFACLPQQTLMQAATAAGVRLPASCSNGLCGTCKTRKLAGEVAMQHKGGIRQRDIDQGWILPCCSQPLSDVVLER
jgi:ferredoxin-NADP reductase